MKDSGCLTAILLLAAVGLLGPILVFGIGWVGGAILRWAFGDMIASGMNLLFSYNQLHAGCHSYCLRHALRDRQLFQIIAYNQEGVIHA